MMDATTKEIVQEGWLIKSPPTKLWKARWRQRWFTLRHSGELPGQYFLEYYVDKDCRKLKGRIDLDQCEQVDAGLSLINQKEKYHFLFNVKTPSRVYYLSAATEAEMNKWVDAICQVCNLKAYEEQQQCQIYSFDAQESPPVSPTSTLLSPYIPISECISGKSLNDTSSLNSTIGQSIDNYHLRRLVPSPPRSPNTDAESIITDDESIPSLPNVNWDTFPSAGDLKPNFKKSSAGNHSYSVQKRFSKQQLNDSVKLSNADDDISIPPRPPKPSHVNDSPGHNYLNLDGATESSKPTTPSTPATNTDSHSSSLKLRQRAIATDASALNKQQQLLQNYNVTTPKEKDNVFRYDFDNNENTNNSNLTAQNKQFSPLSKDNANTVPKIVVPAPPPLVYRELKPGRKINDSNESVESSLKATREDVNANSTDHVEPPSINRKLKPPLAKPSVDDTLHLVNPFSHQSKVKMSPSPTLITKKSRRPLVLDDDSCPFDGKEEIYFYQDDDQFVPASNRRLLVLQYLDLDLEASDSSNNATAQPQHQAPPVSTVYKTVDFVKTEAFNRTKQRVEQERKQCTDELS
ncbi:GRB2-associated-binding protein 2-like [Trichogramma pretiosum]|uniref:GRB2-associated-binding protein 2-like n=1 Tax=Trichogramma pretiosum TaxID=7493 RepID=UPI0006C99739|nr:GRB2-associated-binding protein 2-like [Trichogramma pretiosum]